jgi:hypothetical protein
MVSSGPTLSLVVPTRNRHGYLDKLVRRLLRIDAADLEVVVHDNSDDNSEYFRLSGSIADGRLKYVFNPVPMSITENFERSVGMANGEFVCMLGDDDGVAESIVDLARWMKAGAIDAALAPVSTYLWPGVSGMLDANSSQGLLRLPRYSGKIEIVEESAALDFVLNSGGIRIGDLPSVYQAVISKRALEALKVRAGTYFPGPSPDMASAVGLSAVITKFVRVDLPIVISGSAPGSGAAEGARHRHEGEVADRKFLPADTVPLWPTQVPFFFSGSTLYAATLMRALALTGRDELLSRVRVDRLYAACLVFNPKYRDRVTAVRERHPTLVSSFALIIARGWVWWQRAKALSGNLQRKLISRGANGRQVVGLQDIGAVIDHYKNRFDAQVRGTLAQQSQFRGR